MDAERQAKAYLGDGAYVSHDGYQVWLTTEDGISETNRVALEPDVLLKFIRWLKEQKFIT